MKRILLIILICFSLTSFSQFSSIGILSSSANNQIDLTTGLFAAWNLNETSGTDVVPYVGTIHGTISGGVTVNQTGYEGKCYLFGGTNGKLDMTSTPSLDLENTNFSIGFRIKVGDITAAKYILVKSYDDYNIIINSDESIEFGILGGGTKIRTLYDFIPLNTWTSVIITYNKTSYLTKIYINGIEVSSGTLDALGTTPGDKLFVGSNFTGGEYFSGYLDQLYFWNVELTPTQAAAW